MGTTGQRGEFRFQTFFFNSLTAKDYKCDIEWQTFKLKFGKFKINQLIVIHGVYIVARRVFHYSFPQTISLYWKNCESWEMGPESKPEMTKNNFTAV